MKHLEEGTIQAFLDDELAPRDRAEAAEHLLACGDCRSAQEELTRARATFTEAVALLDVAVPAVEPPAAVRSHGSIGWGGSFVKAASLTLLVAAAASAAVPGSPVREWIVRAVESEPATEAAAPDRASTPVASEPASPPVPVGVSLLPDGPVNVVLSGIQGTSIRLVETDAESVGLSSVGAETDPVFSTAAGRIEVRDAVGGEITIELPRSIRNARITVDGELYAEKADGRLRILVPATTEDGASIWQ